MLSFGDKRVYLACGRTDMRKSINGLSAIVEGLFHLDPFDEAVFAHGWLQGVPQPAAGHHGHRVLVACAKAVRGYLEEAAAGATEELKSQRKYLDNVYLDGRAEISNNRAERSIKPFVVGRKAWLFSTSPAGARASSVMYSIIETAKENGLHPYRYLEFLLQTLPGATSSTLEALLPWSDSLSEYCRAPQMEGAWSK